ncbi:MAG: hypothetical protein AB8B77_03355 [Alphaproteobacteria bacterium]
MQQNHNYRHHNNVEQNIKKMALILVLSVGISACAQLGVNSGSRDTVTTSSNLTSSSAPLNDGNGKSIETVPPNILNIPGIPIPDGVSVSMGDTVIVGADDVWSGQVVMNSESYQPIQLVEFMRLNMPRYGWMETAIVRSRRTSITFVQDDRFATVRVQPREDGGSEIDIVVSPAGQAKARFPNGVPYDQVPQNSPLEPVMPMEPIILEESLN